MPNETTVPAVASPQIEPITLPLTLRTALESGQCVLFLGAGIGSYVRDKAGRPAPDGEELAKRLATRFKIDTGGVYELAKVSEIVELREGRKELETFLKEQLSDLVPGEEIKWLASVRWKAIFTTNYDDAIERAYDLTANVQQKPVSFALTRELFAYDSRFDVPIYHLHGSLFSKNKPSLILTGSDYVTFRESRRMLFDLLKQEFATATVLYLGYSNRDPNWDTVLSEVRSEFYPSPIPPSFRVAPATNPLDAEILRAKGVETLDCSMADFIVAGSAALKDAASFGNLIDAAKKVVPKDLLAGFDKSPAALLKLLSSWTYVNQADFGAHPNTKEFLKGDRPNWALLANHHHFTRDIEEEIYDELLDYVTSESAGSTSLLLLGSAGYGMTTVLMSIATKLVQDNAGPVFYHRPGTPIAEGDVEFATLLFPDKRPFFLVDDSAEHHQALALAEYRMENAKRPICLLLAERTNEWRQRRPKYRPSEFELGALSDPEIYRLLDFLKKHNALKALADLDPKMQFAAIKRKHGKELLVAMMEATEDNSFEAILEDEYRNIGNDLARRLYLSVCCFFQHGAYVRDGLLADILGYSLTDIYEKTGKETEGIVLFDVIDDVRGRYAARARHRKIAEVVWIRCGDQAEKDDLIQRCLSKLNLHYGTDSDAFENLIRSDHIIDSIRSLEGRTKFFETACQKDPLSPYVRQHYARMLLRAGRPEAALGQIDRAIEMNREVRVLYHTKGLIHTDLAIAAENIEIGRRHLVKAEHAFRHELTMFAKDEFAFQGLAQLYLEWAKHVRAEEAEYISKSEEVIQEGLQVVSNKESLWIVSSEVQRFLGSDPAHREALERAVKANPKGVIARYLLARTMRRAGEPDRTIELLQPVIAELPDEYRSCIEYGLAMLAKGEKFEAAAAIVKLGSLYGMKDPRFVATLSGMLFMAGRFTDADQVLEDARKQTFSNAEGNTIHFTPRDPGDGTKRLRLEGAVTLVRAGFCFIEAPGYAKFLCPGSKWAGIYMTKGLRVSFQPAFSARGAQAESPAVI